MARAKTPKIRNDGPVTVLYDRGSETVEREIDGILMTGVRTLPDIYRIITIPEGVWYVRNGITIPDAEVKAIAAEFSALEGAKASA